MPDSPQPPDPPEARPYEPLPEEVYPNAKRVAGRLAQQLTTYGPGDTAEGLLGRVQPDRAVGEPSGSQVAVLLVPDARSEGEVVYAQLGGRTPESVSVMVVVRQRIHPTAGGLRESTRTLDVRLRLVGGEWAFDALASAGGQPVDRPPDLPAPAVAVLDHPRIALPDSVRWDVHRGGVDVRLLETMLAMAERFPYAVTVLSSGHPLEVFGTDRTSDHTGGWAVDVWAVDGIPVVTQRAEGTPAFALSRELFDAGVAQLGSPWDFDAAGRRSFTDVVHADHLHVSVGAPPPALS